MQFYYLPSKALLIFWAPKAACTAITDWVGNSFIETADCEGDPRVFLGSKGYTFSNLINITPIIESGAIKNAIISYREPTSRILSSFINKFLIYGGKPIASSSELESFAKLLARRLASWVSNERSDCARVPDFKGDPELAFSLQDFILFICSGSIRERNIDHHFKPIIWNKNDLASLTRLPRKNIKVFPLRVEHFDDDLLQINRKLLDGTYIPPKINASTLPSPDWSYSSDPQVVQLSQCDLLENKIIPTRSALLNCFAQKPRLSAIFQDRFRFDYQLSSFLDGLASSY